MPTGECSSDFQLSWHLDQACGSGTDTSCRQNEVFEILWPPSEVGKCQGCHAPGWQQSHPVP